MLNYIGNYDYYLEKRDEMKAVYVEKHEKETEAAGGTKKNAIAAQAGTSASGEKLNWEEMKRRQAAARKIENAIKKVEEAIAAEEAKISALEEECAKPENAVNSAKLNEIHARMTEADEKLSMLYEEWESLSLQREEQ